MKKLTLYIAFITLIGILAVGCTDLDEEVFTQIPTDVYGTNEAEINSLIAPIYTRLRDYNCVGSPAPKENCTDMSVTPTRRGGDWWDGGAYKEMTQGKWRPLTSSAIKIYNDNYNRITNFNQIIYLIENSPAITDKEPYLCQVRAARAMRYIDLIDLYGNVPLVTDFEDLTKPSTKPRAEVYTWVLSELNDIKDKIRSDVNSSSYGKFTKGSVYFMLAKMYLNARVWNPAGGEKWQECIDACDVIMSLPYSLEPNWKEQFSANNENSKEAILVAVNSITNSFPSRGYTLHYLDPKALGLPGSANNGICAMPDYAKSFDPDDKRYLGSFLIGPMTDPSTGQVITTAHGRPLIHTVDVTIKYAIDADGWGQVEQEDGARCNKWEFKKGATAMENDCAIYRLADVYLMKAESLVRLGTNNAEATRLVNELRKRAFDPSLHATKLKSSVNLDDIYKERRFELAWENWGRQDMIRFGTFLNPIPGWRPNALDETRLLFPIPQTAIDANPNLEQNPGY
ncbi:MAG TPA: RagB/SusD family nutrient uptake outer membrane protein [Bacteroidales bacterium]|nr:RagB/SusD family nutrient uptake outer membrane protein [Bacteroidales bacterium]